MYTFDKEVLIYTYKNIGVCQMAIGKPEIAEECYFKALAIVDDMVK